MGHHGEDLSTQHVGIERECASQLPRNTDTGSVASISPSHVRKSARRDRRSRASSASTIRRHSRHPQPALVDPQARQSPSSTARPCRHTSHSMCCAAHPQQVETPPAIARACHDSLPSTVPAVHPDRCTNHAVPRHADGPPPRSQLRRLIVVTSATMAGSLEWNTPLWSAPHDLGCAAQCARQWMSCAIGCHAARAHVFVVHALIDQMPRRSRIRTRHTPAWKCQPYVRGLPGSSARC